MSALRKATYTLAQAYSEGYVSSESPVRHQFDYEISVASPEDQVWLACELLGDPQFVKCAGPNMPFVLMMARAREVALELLIEAAEESFASECSA